jgi:hypothetical protein
MTTGTRLKHWLRSGLLSLAATHSANGGDYCCSAPKCWHYNRDVCFGHYQTKWRRWDEICGQSSCQIAEHPSVSKPTIHEAAQAVTMGTPTPRALPVSPVGLSLSRREGPTGKERVVPSMPAPQPAVELLSPAPMNLSPTSSVKLPGK